MTSKEIQEKGDEYTGERSVFVFFAAKDDELPVARAEGAYVRVGIAALIDMLARSNGISFDEAIMQIRETRLMEEVDSWLRVSRKEDDNG